MFNSYVSIGKSPHLLVSNNFIFFGEKFPAMLGHGNTKLSLFLIFNILVLSSIFVELEIGVILGKKTCEVHPH